ncbi:MAG: hemolysin III family protein, partial [Mycolicibacterium sp.]|nr:hemolysin III family protein [Mycolicibacterium sp.]
MPATTPEQVLKPRLRGVLHQWAFAVSLVAGIGLVAEAASARARLAAAVYALSVAALFGTSALYHRVDWRRFRARRWMRRLDH